MNDTLATLCETIRARRTADPKESYVASLQAAGLDRILRKVGEEAAEVLIAAKDCSGQRATPELVGELADLWFHCLVLLDHLDSDASAVLDCLQQRHGLSGLAEKAARPADQP
jgi:phosphoribosyl-ATP pyrophosphohydrolase